MFSIDFFSFDFGRVDWRLAKSFDYDGIYAVRASGVRSLKLRIARCSEKTSEYVKRVNGYKFLRIN